MQIIHENGIYKIYEQEQIGSVEFELETRYIQNIFLNKLYRNKGYLRKIIEYFGKPLIILPLKQHIQKFLHLGFIPYKTIGEDNYYILK